MKKRIIPIFILLAITLLSGVMACGVDKEEELPQKKYDICFLGYEGKNMSVAYGSNYELPVLSQKDEEDFLGWYDMEGVVINTFEELEELMQTNKIADSGVWKIEKNLNLTPIWSNMYPQLSKENYTFDGYQINGGDFDIYLYDTKIDESDKDAYGIIPIYTNNEAGKVKITFEIDGKRYGNIEGYSAGESVKLPKIYPIKENLAVFGYTDNASSVDYEVGDEIVISTDMEFTARFMDAVRCSHYECMKNYFKEDDPIKPSVEDVYNGVLPSELYSAAQVTFNANGTINTYNATASSNALIPSNGGDGNIYTATNGTYFEFFTFKADPIYENGVWYDNNYVSGFIGYPKNAKSGNKLPGMLLLHGGNGAGFDRFESAQKLTAAGYVVVAVDEPGISNPAQNYTDISSGRWKERGYSKVDTYRYQVKEGSTINIKASVIYTAITTSLKAFSILYNCPYVDIDNLGLAGVSWGGYLTTYLSGVLGTMVEAASSAWGSGFYEEEGSFYGMVNALPSDERTAFLTYLDAGRRADNVRGNFFLGAAANDIYFRPIMVKKTLEAMVNAKSVSMFYAPNEAHAATSVPGGTKQDGRTSFRSDDYFFDYYLKGIGTEAPSIKYTKPAYEEDGKLIIEFSYTSPNPIRSNTIKLTVAKQSLSKLWVDRTYKTYVNGLNITMEVLATEGNTTYYRVELPDEYYIDGVCYFVSVSDKRDNSAGTKASFTVSTLVEVIEK